MSVYVSKQWKLAWGVMKFDHQHPDCIVGLLGSQRNHRTSLRGNKVCLCEYIVMKKVFHVSVCVCVCICFHVFLHHLWTHRSGSS